MVACCDQIDDAVCVRMRCQQRAMQIALNKPSAVAQCMKALCERLLFPRAGRNIDLAQGCSLRRNFHERSTGLAQFARKLADEMTGHSATHLAAPQSRPAAIAMIFEANLGCNRQKAVGITAMAVAPMLGRARFFAAACRHLGAMAL